MEKAPAVCLLLCCTGSHDAAQTATAVHAAAAKAAAAQATAAAQGVLPSAAACHAEHGAEYSGDVIKWGESHLQVSLQEVSAPAAPQQLHKMLLACCAGACLLVSCLVRMFLKSTDHHSSCPVLVVC